MANSMDISSGWPTIWPSQTGSRITVHSSSSSFFYLPLPEFSSSSSRFIFFPRCTSAPKLLGSWRPFFFRLVRHWIYLRLPTWRLLPLIYPFRHFLRISFCAPFLFLLSEYSNIRIFSCSHLSAFAPLSFPPFFFLLLRTMCVCACIQGSHKIATLSACCCCCCCWILGLVVCRAGIDQGQNGSARQVRWEAAPFFFSFSLRRGTAAAACLSGQCWTIRRLLLLIQSPNKYVHQVCAHFPTARKIDIVVFVSSRLL